MKTGRFVLLFGLAAMLLAACAPATQSPNPNGRDVDHNTPLPETGSTENNTPALIWHRVGGIAGFCDEVEVFADGEYTAANCSAQGRKQRGQLDAEQRSMLTDWIARFASFQDGEDSKDSTTPTYPDQMFVKTIFTGNGTTKPGAEDIAAISNLAASLAVRPQTGDSYPDAVAKAREFLVQKMGTTLDEIEVVSVESTKWSDRCLGVVIPGVMCAQGITPGYRITLQTEGRDYELHTDESGESIQLVSDPNMVKP